VTFTFKAASRSSRPLRRDEEKKKKRRFFARFSKITMAARRPLAYIAAENGRNFSDDSMTNSANGRHKEDET